jgi:hypothetical protein
MIQVIRKAYWDYEKEESWLNQMSAMGMALIDYSWCRYVFEQAQPNEYIYRLELLKNHHSHPDSISYIRFLEESGVECVAKYMRWIYLRKKASEGPFDIYTDLESKYKYYKRVFAFWNTLFLFEFSIGLFNLLIGIINGTAINLICSIPCLCFAIVFAKVNLRNKMRIKKYEQERTIHE